MSGRGRFPLATRTSRGGPASPSRPPRPGPPTSRRRRGGSECRRELDVMQRLRPRFPGVRFAAVAVRGDRGALRTLIRRRGWTFPIGYDRDGAVANLYGVAVCPTIVFAYPGRRTMLTD